MKTPPWNSAGGPEEQGRAGERVERLDRTDDRGGAVGDAEPKQEQEDRPEAGEASARGRSMIARTWKGRTRREDADAYADYLRRTGIRSYRATGGNLGVLSLRRIDGDEAEFLLVSLWESPEAIAEFAGEDAERAVFYPEDERYLTGRDLRVDHFEVFDDPAPTS